MEDGLAATQVALQTIQQRLDVQKSRFDAFTNVVTACVIGDVVISDTTSTDWTQEHNTNAVAYGTRSLDLQYENDELYNLAAEYPTIARS